MMRMMTFLYLGTVSILYLSFFSKVSRVTAVALACLVVLMMAMMMTTTSLSERFTFPVYTFHVILQVSRAADWLSCGLPIQQYLLNLHIRKMHR